MLSSADLLKPFRVTDGSKFRLKRVDPGDTCGLRSEFKDEAPALLARGIKRLSELQERLYAQDRWAVLLIFQAMDAAGKDSTIKHVMSGVNPQGVEVSAFKQPSHEELDHDFLWRCIRRLPERGRIGIFNRSYYEEVLVVRVHPEILAGQKLPPELVTQRLWDERFQDIRAVERYLARNGTVIRKFFLHVSKKEQRKRFLERTDEPSKNWKFALGDVHERQHWKEYVGAYEDAIRETATKHAPWFVVPADTKWFTRIVVAAAVVEALEELDLHFPKVDARQRAELRAARRLLEREG
jgi:PPK2 family polyphosphate:nucleotide phosphotransferase